MAAALGSPHMGDLPQVETGVETIHFHCYKIYCQFLPSCSCVQPIGTSRREYLETSDALRAPHAPQSLFCQSPAQGWSSTESKHHPKPLTRILLSFLCSVSPSMATCCCTSPLPQRLCQVEPHKAVNPPGICPAYTSCPHPSEKGFKLCHPDSNTILIFFLKEYRKNTKGWLLSWHSGSSSSLLPSSLSPCELNHSLGCGS